SRMHDPLVSQSLPRLGCLWGTFSPSRCQIRSTRLSLIVQPAWRSSSAILQYGRYGYRKIAELLRQAGWTINDKRVERIWQREGLKVPHKQPKRGRLWLTNGSCIRLRPEQRNHV